MVSRGQAHGYLTISQIRVLEQKYGFAPIIGTKRQITWASKARINVVYRLLNNNLSKQQFDILKSVSSAGFWFNCYKRQRFTPDEIFAYLNRARSIVPS